MRESLQSESRWTPEVREPLGKEGRILNQPMIIVGHLHGETHIKYQDTLILQVCQNSAKIPRDSHQVRNTIIRQDQSLVKQSAHGRFHRRRNPVGTAYQWLHDRPSPQQRRFFRMTGTSKWLALLEARGHRGRDCGLGCAAAYIPKRPSFFSLPFCLQICSPTELCFQPRTFTTTNVIGPTTRCDKGGTDT